MTRGLAEMLDDAATELLQLLPRLDDAIERDHTPGGRRSTGSRPPAQPVNPDVLDALVTLATEPPRVDAWARQLLGDQPRQTTPETAVAAAVALYRRLLAVTTSRRPPIRSQRPQMAPRRASTRQLRADLAARDERIRELEIELGLPTSEGAAR